MELTKEQQKKLKKVAKIVDVQTKGNAALLEYLFELDDEIPELEDMIEKLQSEMLDANQVKEMIDEVVSKIKIPVAINGEKGDKGDSYILTEQDKKEIASKIDVPIVEKVVETIKEKTEVIREQPIEVIKEVAVVTDADITSRSFAIRDGLEVIVEEDDKLKITAIGNLRKELDELKKIGGEHRVIGANRNLYQLLDVDVAGITTDQSIKWDGTKWVAYTPSGAGSSPLTTKGDIYGYDTADTRIPIGADGYVLTADSADSKGVSWQPAPSGGVFTYYWTPTASDVAGLYKQLDTPFPTLSTFTTTGATHNQLLRTYVTEADVPSLTFIPAGEYKVHIHANVATITGKKDTHLRAEIWEVSSTGTDIVKIADCGPTSVLTDTSAEYIIGYSSPQVNLTSIASRIETKIYATITGTGGQPDITISVGDGTDSNTTFPAVTVNATNFVTTNTTQSITASKTFTVNPTLSAMTEGSVPYIGIGGLFSQNNQNFFWNTNPSFNPNTLNIAGALGSEQITNGSFTGSATGWTLNTGWVYGSNAVSKTSNGVGALTQSISTMTNGLIGIVSITVSALTVGTITVSVGNATVATISANGTYTYRFVSSNTSGIVITPSNTARLTVDDVSVKYLTGGGLVVGGASFFRNKITVAQNNTSTTLGGTSDHLELLNTTASGVTNFNFKFAQTALSGIQATSTGRFDFIATNISSGGGFTWKLGSNVSTLSDYGNLDVNGWSTNENGRFAKKVIAGLNTVTAPATLNNNGSYAGRGVLITTTDTVLTNAYEFVYLDSSLTAGCTGTTAVDCSAQTNSTDCDLYTALGCVSAFGNCIDFTDEESCNAANPPCGWVTTAPCDEFNANETACTTTTGCTANYDGDCTVFGDETTCIANSGCVWDGGCTGFYYTSCSGEYDVTPYCGGGEYGSCEGTASCGNITSEATCDGTSPCVWGEQQIVFLPSIANARQNNMSLKYAIKKTGGTGNSIVKPFDTSATIEGATEKVFSTVGDSIVIHFFDKTVPCSSYTNEGACNAIDGCTWDTDTCTGTPTALPSWNIIADKV